MTPLWLLLFCCVVAAQNETTLSPETTESSLESTISAEEEWLLSEDGSGNTHVVNSRNIIDDIMDPLVFNAMEETLFQLYTQLNPTTPQDVRMNHSSIISSNYRPWRPTRFLIHGWTSNGNAPMNILIRDAYLRVGDFNIFVVDWGAGAFAEYIIARNRVDDVGIVVARFIDFLYTKIGLDLRTVYLVGHSLGAHICGYVGKYVRSGQIPVIFGLDPVQHFFELNSNERLTDQDALYVETIHTAAILVSFAENIGRASFYPNYGKSQGGCFEPSCNHRRAYELFAESIYTTIGFWSLQCSTWQEIINSDRCTEIGPPVLMGGEPAQTTRAGVFYVPTKSTSPYAKGFI